MSVDLGLLARLLAHEQGRAHVSASHRRVAVRPDALVVAPLAMAGEDTTVHIVAIGDLSGAPEVACVPDPRMRDDQYRLFRWMGERLENYAMLCRHDGAYPQIWVSSGAAASHLDTLADRLRFNRQDDRVRRFGEMLAYWTERYPYRGQQALLTATGALAAHWATGQDEGEDEHLGALLTWIQPPTGSNVLVAVSEAERVPMGVKTDPEFDRDVLAPLVAAYDSAKREGAPDRILTYRARLIREALEPVVIRIFEATQRAMRLLLESDLPPLPDLPALEQRESESFASYMQWLDRGGHVPLRDKPRAAAHGLTAREDAVETFEAAVMLGDRVGRAQAVLSGRLLVGEVQNPVRLPTSLRRATHRFDVVSTQRALRLRVRDQLRWVEDPRLQVIVTAVHREGGVTRATLEIQAGMRAVGPPAAGLRMELSHKVPDWNGLVRKRGHLKARLAMTPWTHGAGGIPARQSQIAPTDPLAAMEALR